ncbi:MAG: GGDEF domain-containing protein, partial [Gorillibacterium sp.]|nr:GGDEF domain-containing protein [Gorillibacterium sp.]
MSFIVLFALFVYVFSTVTITNLHKVYLLFHFSMMLWPFCMFAIKLAENPKYQLFFVKLAFVDTALLTSGWLLFTIFLTGQAQFLRKKISFVLFIPVLVIALGVIANPNGKFVLPVNGGYVERTYGPIFLIMIMILVAYVGFSLYIIYMTLASNSTPRIKKQVANVLKGVLVLTALVLLDIFLNVVLSYFLPVIPGLTSLGILLSASLFIIAIHRDKIFDLVTIAHRDIIDTIEHGILVLDDNETIVEINYSLLPHCDLHRGDRFDMATFLPKNKPASKLDFFLHTYLEEPLERIEIELFHPRFNGYINIHAAPILVSGIVVGRIIVIQDVTKLKSLMDETTLQNEVLQEHN